MVAWWRQSVCTQCTVCRQWSVATIAKCYTALSYACVLLVVKCNLQLSLIQLFSVGVVDASMSTPLTL